MRNRLIALALLVAAIAVLAALYTQHRNRAQPPAVPLTTLAPDALTRLVVKAQGKPTLVLARDAAGWRMREPIRTRADTGRVAALLSALDEATARHYAVSALSLAEVGLEPPAFTLEAGGVRLEFGALNPANLLRYVRRGDTVYLVFDTIAPRLAAGPWPFVDRRLLPPGAVITGIAATIPGEDKPMSHAKAWLGAQAMQIKPLANGEGKDAPTIEISLEGRKQAIVFALLARAPELEFARSDLGIVYVLAGSLAHTLLPPSRTSPDAGTAGG